MTYMPATGHLAPIHVAVTEWWMVHNVPCLVSTADAISLCLKDLSIFEVRTGAKLPGVENSADLSLVLIPRLVAMGLPCAADRGMVRLTGCSYMHLP